MFGAYFVMEIVLNSKKYGAFTVYYDEQDHELICKLKWCLYLGRPKCIRKYAITNISDGNNWHQISMHRLIMRFPIGMEVDHINGNGLDNRRNNLRICTHSENNMNKPLQSNNKLGYKGVYFKEKEKRVKKYQCYIWVDNKRISGGYFKTAKEAALKYNELAIKYHKEFAKLNII